jgi:hypothetical protein
MSRPKFTMPGHGEVPVRSNKTSYIGNGRNKGQAIVEIEDDEDESYEVPVRCANSTGIFLPPYWSFVFSDANLRDHVCIMVSMPSGLLDKNGLDGKVDATVSTCRKQLSIAVEWPESITRARCMQDALSVTWNASVHDGTTSFGVASTVSNILQAFEKELRKIRIQNKVTANNMLGSTVVVDLPFEVESDMVLCQPNLDRKFGSVILYVVLKKTLKKHDQFSVKRMSIRVSNAYDTTLPVQHVPPSTKKRKVYESSDQVLVSLKTPLKRLPVPTYDEDDLDCDEFNDEEYSDASCTAVDPKDYYKNMN